MSSKKVFSRSAHTPGTAGKGRNKPPTPKHQLNATASSKTSNVQADATTVTAGPSLAPQLTATDWSLQCDLVYSEYLQALVNRHIVQERAQHIDEAIDVQLAQQADVLRRAKLEDVILVNEIEEKKMQREIEKLYSRLEETFKNIYELLRDYNVEDNLLTYRDFCENACNKLYLTNIKPFQTQQDYDNFTTLLERCTDTLKKLKIIIGNTEATQVVGEHISKYVDLENEIRAKQKTVSDLQSSLNLLIYKNASDRFAEAEEDNLN